MLNSHPGIKVSRVYIDIIVMYIYIYDITATSNKLLSGKYNALLYTETCNLANEKCAQVFLPGIDDLVK